MKPGDRFLFTSGIFKGKTITYTRSNLRSTNPFPYLGTILSSYDNRPIEITWGKDEKFIKCPTGQIADFLS